MECFPRACRGDPIQLRQAYLRLARLYHPDKVQGRSVAEQNAATAKFQAIQAAYDQLTGRSGRFSGKATPRLFSDFAAACKQGDLEKVLKLLKLRPESANDKDELDVTPLMFAASSGSAAVCEALLEAKADLAARNPLGWTALTWASLQGRMEVLHCLMHRGAAISNYDLSIVAFAGRWEVFGALLASCGDSTRILAIRDKLRLGLLHFSLAGLAYLKRPPPDHLRCMELAIAARCDPEVEDRIAATPVLRYFVDNMAEAWVMNRLDKSPNHQHAVRRLCSLKADPMAKGLDGWTAVDAARNGGMQEILVVLEEVGMMIEPGWSEQEFQPTQALTLQKRSLKSFL